MKPFFALASLLLLSAIVMDVVAKEYCSDVMVMQAKNAQEQTPTPSVLSTHGGDYAELAAICLFCAGIMAWIVSAIRKERRHNFVIVLLVLVFILVWFTWV